MTATKTNSAAAAVNELHLLSDLSYEAGLIGADLTELRACFRELSKGRPPHRAAAVLDALVSVLKTASGGKANGGIERGINRLRELHPLQRSQMFCQYPGAVEAYSALVRLADPGGRGAPSALTAMTNSVKRTG